MTAHVNHPIYLFQRMLLKFLIRPWLFIVKGFRIAGKEDLPKRREPFILIANHAAFVDSIYIICALKPRFTICGAKPKYFRKSILRWIFTVANILKVESRQQFLTDCVDLLEKNEPILIYPEMGRNPESMGEFQTWAAEVALASGASVIPCYVYGTTEGQTGRKRLIVGEKLTPAGDAQSLTLQFRNVIERLKSQVDGNGGT